MAVYERNYTGYDGELTDERSRFLVIPRFAIEEVFKSKLVLIFFALPVIGTLLVSILIYLPHNAAVLKLFQETSGGMAQEFFNYGTGFFRGWTIYPSMMLAFIMVFIVGPPLVSADLRNNGLALYMARPFSRWEYILGKLAVLVPLLAAVGWVPSMWLFVFQSYLAGMDWFKVNWRIGLAILVGQGLWVLFLSLISLAISAYVKWKPVARMAILAVLIIPMGAAPIINQLLDTKLGNVINMMNMMLTLSDGIMGLATPRGFPVGLAGFALLAAVGLALAVLSRKLRPYEVVG
ncbi:MAG: hypothetical protein OEV00_04235 [Acidobacteriota bacterium]|nr:hypothetical protein [Acidobacteriota bacterium]MDH3784521.1 hypothetical protein [Acidobacteriota bacterium]